MENTLYTETEAAKFLAISTSTLQKSRTKSSTAIENGLLPPFVKLRGSVRYTKQDLNEFVSNLTRRGAGDKPVPQKSKIVMKEVKKTPELNIVEESEFTDSLKGMCNFLK
tara:strand:- start:3585 stop:3914 length:330 start_codon:yes stop_codon:yes gene_type:complete